MEDRRQDPLVAENDDGMRQSHTCCGCCCDCRAAVLAIDTVCLVFLIIDLFKVIDTFHMVGLVCLGAGIFGAYDYQSVLIGLAGVFHAITFISELWDTFAGASSLVPISIVFAYPHYFLYNEIESGVMSKSRYSQEQHCCTRV